MVQRPVSLTLKAVQVETGGHLCLLLRLGLGGESMRQQGAAGSPSSPDHFQSPGMLPEEKPSVTQGKSPQGPKAGGGKAGIAPAS